MIYFVQAIDGGPIKIGTTIDLDARLKQLEAHYGRPLALLHAMEGGRAEEAEIHARFAHLRFRKTEQFLPGPDLMLFIGRPLFVNQGDVPLMEPMAVSGYVAAKIDAEVLRKAKIVAAYRDQSLAEFLSIEMGKIVDRLLDEEHSKEVRKPRRKGKIKEEGGSE